MNTRTDLHNGQKLNIVADAKIPFLRGVLEPFVNMEYLVPEKITAEAVKNADALIVRTRTRCNEQLLEGSSVKMIATATIGFDHIDRDYCARKGIVWKNAPGCNAPSVAQYVLSAVSLIVMKRCDTLSGKTIGLVGVGNVGKAVEHACRTIGMNVLRCDPIRARLEGADGFVSLDTVARESDFISFHTPLTRNGEDATFHLANVDFFSKVAKKPVLINTSRGEVVDENALMQAYRNGVLSDMIIDCWEHEPNILTELMDETFLSTPHIAGYSADGKSNATRMAVENIADFFQLSPDLSTISAPQIESSLIDASLFPDHTLGNLLLQTYDPRQDTVRLRNNPQTFEKQRGDYPLRREYKAYTIVNAPLDLHATLLELGFCLK